MSRQQRRLCCPSGNRSIICGYGFHGVFHHAMLSHWESWCSSHLREDPAKFPKTSRLCLAANERTSRVSSSSKILDQYIRLFRLRRSLGRPRSSQWTLESLVSGMFRNQFCIHWTNSALPPKLVPVWLVGSLLHDD